MSLSSTPDRFDAGRRLAGSAGGLSWGKSVFNFNKLTKAAGLDMQEESDKITDRVGRFLKNRAEARTPVKTGKGQKSWAMSTKRVKKKRTNIVFNTAKTPKGLYYLNFVERGTVNIAPRRFFAKALAEAREFEKRQYENLKRTISRRFNRGTNA